MKTKWLLTIYGLTNTLIGVIFIFFTDLITAISFQSIHDNNEVDTLNQVVGILIAGIGVLALFTRNVEEKSATEESIVQGFLFAILLIFGVMVYHYITGMEPPIGALLSQLIFILLFGYTYFRIKRERG